MNIPILHAPYSKLHNLLSVSYLPKVIHAAIEIDLFDLLSNTNLQLKGRESYSVEEITEALQTAPSVTKALINVLHKVELLTMVHGEYALSTMAEEYLVKTAEASQVMMMGKFTGSQGPFDHLVDSLKGEKPTFSGRIWESKETALAMEQGAKAGGLQQVLQFVKGIPQFAHCTKMCDVAGNIGYYSYALIQENNKLVSHVYDLPKVCQNGRELKREEKDYDRVVYQEIDLKQGGDFVDTYDLVFVSHFLYEYGVNGQLVDFLKRVHRAMKPGGVLISNHICDEAIDQETDLTLALVELQTRVMGYPTHQLPEKVLKEALTEAGFGDFTVQKPTSRHAYPTLLLAAVKQ